MRDPKIVSNKICTSISYPLHSYLLFGFAVLCCTSGFAYIYIVTNRMKVDSLLPLYIEYNFALCSITLLSYIHTYIHIFNACCVCCFCFLRFYARLFCSLERERAFASHIGKYKQLHIIYMYGDVFLCAFETRSIVIVVAVAFTIRHSLFGICGARASKPAMAWRCKSEMSNALSVCVHALWFPAKMHVYLVVRCVLC